MRIKSRIFPILSVITFALLSTAACKKDNTVQGPAVAPLSFVFQNRVNQEPVELGVGSYTNANGNAFSFDMLKYYISNIVLVTDDGKEVALNNHSLIDAANLGSEQLQFDSIPKGHYTSMRFQLGIDSLHNHNLDQAGDLDPVNGMFWSWNTGYIFLKHEGTYRNANNEWDQLLFHYGTDGALTAVELALPDVNLDDNGKKIYLNFDFYKLYSSPNIMDFDIDHIRQSASYTDRDWLAKQMENVPGAFSVDRVE